MTQQIISIQAGYEALDGPLRASGVRTLLLVCGPSAEKLAVGRYFAGLEARLGIRVVKFSDFTPNPQYPSVTAGVRRFRQEGCGLVAAVGGGSAMDVAKCIKAFAAMEGEDGFLDRPIRPNDIPLWVVPTTAGTGSEATRFAVIYRDGEKLSVEDDACLPSVVVMDPAALDSLPDYHRRATMLDALCHAVEAFWSVRSTEQSRAYAAQAIRAILQNKDGYLANTAAGNEGMLYAAHTAGKAINLAQTTAGHAMCYKLTGLYGLAHGHAAALCVAQLWPYMLEHPDGCTDPRGTEHLRETFEALADAMGGGTPSQAAGRFGALVRELGLPRPVPGGPEDLAVLTGSVNRSRLQNNPVALDAAALEGLYRQILGEVSR